MCAVSRPEKPQFVDLRKPVQMVKIQKFSIGRLTENGLHSMMENVRICAVDKLDRAVTETIIQIAREAGFTSLVLLNKAVIIRALREYEERHLSDEAGTEA